MRSSLFVLVTLALVFCALSSSANADGITSAVNKVQSYLNSRTFSPSKNAPNVKNALNTLDDEFNKIIKESREEKDLRKEDIERLQRAVRELADLLEDQVRTQKDVIKSQKNLLDNGGSADELDNTNDQLDVLADITEQVSESLKKSIDEIISGESEIDNSEEYGGEEDSSSSSLNKAVLAIFAFVASALVFAF